MLEFVHSYQDTKIYNSEGKLIHKIQNQTSPLNMFDEVEINNETYLVVRKTQSTDLNKMFVLGLMRKLDHLEKVRVVR